MYISHYKTIKFDSINLATNLYYNKRFVSRINPSLVLKINLYNTFNNINQMKLCTKDN